MNTKPPPHIVHKRTWKLTHSHSEPWTVRWFRKYNIDDNNNNNALKKLIYAMIQRVRCTLIFINAIRWQPLHISEELRTCLPAATSPFSRGNTVPKRFSLHRPSHVPTSPLWPLSMYSPHLSPKLTHTHTHTHIKKIVPTKHLVNKKANTCKYVSFRGCNLQEIPFGRAAASVDQR